MNGTNASETESPWLPFTSFIGDVSIQCGWTTLVLSVVQIGVLAVLMKNELKATSDVSPNKARVFSPMNVLLLSLILSNYFTMLFSGLQSAEADPLLVIVYGALCNFFGFGFQALTLYYTYYRGLPVVKTTALWCLFYLRVMVVLYELLQIALFVLFVLNTLPLDEAAATIVYDVILDVTLASDAVVLAPDLCIVCIFLAFLRRIKREGGSSKSDSNKMIIISSYGIATFICYQAYLGVSIGLTFIFTSINPPVSFFTFTCLYYLQLYLPAIYIFIQLAMKWAVFAEKARASSRLHGNSSNTAGKKSGSKTTKGK